MVDKLAKKIGVNPDSVWFEALKVAGYAGVAGAIGYLTAVGVMPNGWTVDFQKLWTILTTDPKTFVTALAAASVNSAWVAVIKSGVIGKVTKAILGK